MRASDVVAFQDAVYMCTGNPLPSDITKMIETLLNKPFKTAYDCELHFHSGGTIHPH
mgnify:CR=1 FL=1